MDQADESLHQGHDKLSKCGLSAPAAAAAFLRWRPSPALAGPRRPSSALVGPRRPSPALAESGDLEAVCLEPGSFIDSQFRCSESDLLFSAPFRGQGSNDPGCLFYFLATRRSRGLRQASSCCAP